MIAAVFLVALVASTQAFANPATELQSSLRDLDITCVFRHYGEVEELLVEANALVPEASTKITEAIEKVRACYDNINFYEAFACSFAVVSMTGADLAENEKLNAIFQKGTTIVGSVMTECF